MPDMNWQFDTLLSNEKASNTAWLLAFRWRRRWDSNPRALADNRISSAARYDHFDTCPDEQKDYIRFQGENQLLFFAGVGAARRNRRTRQSLPF